MTYLKATRVKFPNNPKRPDLLLAARDHLRTVRASSASRVAMRILPVAPTAEDLASFHVGRRECPGCLSDRAPRRFASVRGAHD